MEDRPRGLLFPFLRQWYSKQIQDYRKNFPWHKPHGFASTIAHQRPVLAAGDSRTRNSEVGGIQTSGSNSKLIRAHRSTYTVCHENTYKCPSLSLQYIEIVFATFHGCFKQLRLSRLEDSQEFSPRLLHVRLQCIKHLWSGHRHDPEQHAAVGTATARLPTADSPIQYQSADPTPKWRNKEKEKQKGKSKKRNRWRNEERERKRRRMRERKKMRERGETVGQTPQRGFVICTSEN